MAVPYTPLAVGHIQRGRSSWFGGPHDPSDSGHTASGISEALPGIAVYNRATLGGYWRVRFANGRSLDLRQTDIGPAPFTGRNIDILYSALGLAGYTEQTFPTDSVVSATYLGKTLGGHVPVTLRGHGTPVQPRPLPGVASTSSSSGSSGSSGSSSSGGGIGGDLKHALVWVGLVVTGVILLGLGVNRASGGAPGRGAKKTALVAAAAV